MGYKFSKIFEKKTARQGAGHVLKKALDDDIVSWICEQYPLKQQEQQTLATFVYGALAGLQEECGRLVQKSKIDTSYISSLLFKQKQAGSEKL